MLNYKLCFSLKLIKTKSSNWQREKKKNEKKFWPNIAHINLTFYNVKR